MLVTRSLRSRPPRPRTLRDPLAPRRYAIASRPADVGGLREGLRPTRQDWVYGKVANPACRKFASNVTALRMPRFSMRTKEVQSVKDHRLSDRRTKSFQAASKAGNSTLTSRRFFDSRIAWPPAEERNSPPRAEAAAWPMRLRANNWRACLAASAASPPCNPSRLARRRGPHRCPASAARPRPRSRTARARFAPPPGGT